MNEQQIEFEKGIDALNSESGNSEIVQVTNDPDWSMWNDMVQNLNRHAA